MHREIKRKSSSTRSGRTGSPSCPVGADSVAGAIVEMSDRKGNMLECRIPGNSVLSHLIGARRIEVDPDSVSPFAPVRELSSVPIPSVAAIISTMLMRGRLAQ